MAVDCSLHAIPRDSISDCGAHGAACNRAWPLRNIPLACKGQLKRFTGDPPAPPLEDRAKDKRIKRGRSWEGQVDPNQMQHSKGTTAGKPFMQRALGLMSIITMVMTVPQVLTIWVGHQAAGVSVLSWGAYLASAILWLMHGLQEADRNIYLPCLGWIALDGAVIVGALMHR